MSFSSAGKNFSSHVPSKVKIQMPARGRRALQGPASVPSRSLFPGPVATHTDDHQLPDPPFRCPVPCGSFSLASPRPS